MDAHSERSPRKKPQPNGTPPPDRLPPHSLESERALLGCILLDAQQVLPQCIGKLTPASFYDQRNAQIYETMLELFEDNAPIETASLYERLQAWGKAESVGGVAYLGSLPDNAPPAANGEYYIGIVRDKHLMRQMVHVCVESVQRIYDHEGNTDELMDLVERDVLHVAESRTGNDTPSTLELVREAIRNFETYFQRNGELIGLGTGFVDFDKRTQGLRPGNMIVLAARPSLGKTSLALNIADHVAVENHIPTAIFSLEMTAVELMERMVSSRARINIRSLRDGFLPNRDLPRITTASSVIASAPLYIDDRARSILEVRAKARRWYQQYGIRFVIIDYLQLMNSLGGKRKFENRQQEISDISNGSKALAKELNVPVLVISQLNRAVEKEKRRPRLSDLRESGSIEQDADLVAFLSREDFDDDTRNQDEEAVPTILDISKQRNGPQARVFLTFLKSYTRFESTAKVADDDAAQESPQTSLPYHDD